MPFIIKLPLIVLLFSQTGLAQSFQVHQVEPRHHSQVYKLMHKIAEERLKDKIAGISITAFDREGPLFSASSGVANLATNKKLNPHRSLFRVASVSKMFTSLAINQLVEQKRLSLDAPVTSLEKAPFVQNLKSCAGKDPQWIERWEKITVAHLLSHRSGISKDLPGANVFFDKDAIKDGSYPSMETFYTGLCDIEHLFEPGMAPFGAKYSNLAFNLLARIVEAYNPWGLSFPRYVESLVMDPLAMYNSGYSIAKRFGHRFATSYSNFGSVVENPDLRGELPNVYSPLAYDGSIGVAATAVDLGKLGAEFLRLFGNDSRALGLSSRSFKNILTPTTRFNQRLAWGLGFYWNYLPGQKDQDPLWVGHSGTGYGERALLIVSPELKTGVALQFNSRTAFREKYAKIIVEGLGLKVSETGPSTKNLLAQVRSFLSNTQPPKVEKPVPGQTPPHLKDYTGEYLSTVTGRSHVTSSEAGKLVMFGFELITVDAEKGLFRFPPEGGVFFSSEPVEFLRDESGQVKAVKAAQVKFLTKISEEQKTSASVGKF